MADKEKIYKKYQKVFLIEYIAISAVLLLVGFLRMFDVMKYSETRLLVYNIITLIGVAYIIFDLCWNLRKSKRKDFSPVDKIPPLFLAAFLLTFDILVLSKTVTDLDFIKYSICGVLFSAGIYSLVIGIYHYFKPQKMFLEAVEEAYQAALLEEQEEAQKQEENKPEE